MKKLHFTRDHDELARQRALLLALSSDLSLPLLQIKNSLELLANQNYTKSASLAHAESTALSVDMGLQLVEAYKLLLGASGPEHLPSEPVAIGAVLDEIAHRLTPYAKKYHTELQVSVQPKMEPILVHYPSLRSALEILGSSLIRAQPAQKEQKSYQIILGSHRLPGNMIAAGVFSNVNGLSDRTLRAARALLGKARQPLPVVPEGSAAGVLVADMLCETMWQPLRSSAHNNLHGLATVVPASQQLQFV